MHVVALKDSGSGRALLASVACAAWLVPSAVWACDPVAPLEGWSEVSSFPQDGMEDAPINGVLALRAALFEQDLEVAWPQDEGALSQAISLRLTRGQGEEVDAEVVFDPEAREARLVTELPLNEGVTYTLEATLDSLALGLDGQTVVYEASFTTGNRFDEAPPPFSGAQSLELTQRAVPVQDCCPGTEDYCLCGPFPCQWCWTVDFDYLPLARLTWRAVDDEFGPEAVSYLIHRVAGPEAAPEGEPLAVVRGREPGPSLLEFPLEADESGPICFMVRAVDVYGRRDGNQTVLCRGLDEVVPIDGLEVPPEDRSQCASDELDAGVPDAGPPDAGTPDVGPDEGDAADPDVPGADTGDVGVSGVSEPGGGSCGCGVPAAPVAPWGWPALLGMGLWLVARRRRR